MIMPGKENARNRGSMTNTNSSVRSSHVVGLHVVGHVRVRRDSPQQCRETVPQQVLGRSPDRLVGERVNRIER